MVESPFTYIPLLGDFDELGYHYVEISVGTPSQTLRVIADTGSSLLAFPCEDCGAGDCAPSHIRFLTKNSSSNENVLCADKVPRVLQEIGHGIVGGDGVEEDKTLLSPKCSSCGSGGECLYMRRYAEGSSLEGRYVRDQVILGGIRARTTFGCHVKELGLFTSQTADGILGLSGSLLSLPSAWSRDGASRGSGSFAFCATRKGGRITVGGLDTSASTMISQSIKPKVQSTKLNIGADGFYRIPLISIHLIAACDITIGGGGGNPPLRRGISGGGGGGGGVTESRECIARRQRPWTGPWGGGKSGKVRDDTKDTATTTTQAAVVGGGHAVLDTGSSYTYLPSAALANIIEGIQRECWGNELPSGGVTDTAKGAGGGGGKVNVRRCAGTRIPHLSLPSAQVFCVRLDGNAADDEEKHSLASFPFIQVQMEGGGIWSIPSSSLLLRTPWSAGLHCLQIFDSEEVGGRIVFGTNAMLNLDVAFLTDTRRVEWVQSNCDLPKTVVATAAVARKPLVRMSNFQIHATATTATSLLLTFILITLSIVILVVFVFVRRRRRFSRRLSDPTPFPLSSSHHVSSSGSSVLYV